LGDACARITAAIGHPPEGLSLDRIDVNGHYEIGNLRWATDSEQMRNRRRIGGIQSHAYKDIVLEIERRMSQCGMINVPMLAHAIGTLKLGCQ
jgi:hypothetical protein